jgi:hypothetical protein
MTAQILGGALGTLLAVAIHPTHPAPAHTSQPEQPAQLTG